MLIYKSKLMYVTSVSKKGSNLHLELNNLFKFDIDNYEGPDFNLGRLIILCLNSKKQIISLYLVDSKSKPFQIYGAIDVLLEGCVIYNETKELVKQNAYATQLCISAFNSLTKEQIQNYINDLNIFENMIFKTVYHENLGWKSIKKIIGDLINSIDFNADVNSRIKYGISVSPMPQKAINKKNTIDLEDYIDSVFVNYWI